MYCFQTGYVKIFLMIKQNEQVITSDKNESYDHTHEIEMRPLHDKNKKLFNRMVSDMVVTNLVNSKYISSEEFVDRKFEVINDMLQRAYGAGHNIFLELIERKTEEPVGFLWYRLHDEQIYKDMAYICSICIMRSYRERGYAAIVLKLLGKYLKKEKGIARLALMVSSRNDAAIHLYKSAGFEPVEFIMHKFL